jgi:3-methyladenine DNA glycosylase AlkC
MHAVPPLHSLSWAKIRTVAGELASSTPVESVVAIAHQHLTAPEVAYRQFGVYVLGFISAARPDQLEVLRTRVVPDPHWQVQEALAQAFDSYCAALGYEAALPTIDRWLADEHPNARRAVTEGLRPWTSKRRTYFARQPAEAIRRLAALRADPSEYVRHSVGNALRDIRRTHPALVDAETATWNLADTREQFTYLRVQRAR